MEGRTSSCSERGTRCSPSTGKCRSRLIYHLSSSRSITDPSTFVRRFAEVVLRMPRSPSRPRPSWASDKPLPALSLSLILMIIIHSCYTSPPSSSLYLHISRAVISSRISPPAGASTPYLLTYTTSPVSIQSVKRTSNCPRSDRTARLSHHHKLYFTCLNP